MGRLKNGQVMVELLLALAISAVGLVAMVQIATKSLSNSSSSSNRSEAVKYASQGVEWVRGQRSASTFFTATGDHCMSTIPADFAALVATGPCSSTTVIPGTNLRRQVTLDSSVSNQQRVTINMSWTERGSTINSQQVTIFRVY